MQILHDYTIATVLLRKACKQYVSTYQVGKYYFTHCADVPTMPSVCEIFEYRLQ